MATTGTYTYDRTGAEIITEALRKCGVLEEGASASAAQVTDALPSFEAMIKALGNYGLQLWTNDQISITLVQGQEAYTADVVNYIDVTNVIFRDSDGNDTPLTPISREEYYALNDKDEEQDLPTQYYWERKKIVATGVDINRLYIWPTASATIAGQSLIVRAQRQFMDVGNGTNQIDVPQEWMEAIQYNLAVRLAPSYGVPLQERMWLKQEAKEALNLVLSNDVEKTSLFIQPNTRGR